MCGLVGVGGNSILHSDLKVFKQGLYANALRGFHSTGVAIASLDNKTHRFNSQVNKRAAPASVYLSDNAINTFMDSAIKLNSKILMGHNRHATLGAITPNNAHPFKDRHITLAHNGTLTSQYNLPNFEMFDVDSENIAHAIAEEGVDKTIPKLMGAFALSWIDHNEETFNLIRNDERSLYLFINKTSGKFFYCSEQEMGEWLLERNNWYYTEVYELEPGQLFTFNMRRLSHSYEEMEVRELELWEPPPVFDRRNNGWGGGSRKVYPPPVNLHNQQSGGTVEKKYQANQKSGEGGTRGRSDKRQSDISDTLKYHGLEPDQEVLFVATKFVPYKDTDEVGFILGDTVDPPFLPVEIHGVDKDWFDQWATLITRADAISYRDGYWPILMGHEIIVDEDSPREEGPTDEDKENAELAEMEIEFEVVDEEERLEKKDELLRGKRFRGPHGHDLTFKEMDFLTRGGCAVCTDNIYEEDYSKIGWTPNGLPLCNDCKNEWSM